MCSVKSTSPVCLVKNDSLSFGRVCVGCVCMAFVNQLAQLSSLNFSKNFSGPEDERSEQTLQPGCNWI